MRKTSRFLAILLALFLVTPVVAGLAEAPVISDLTPIHSHYNPPYDHTVWKPVASFTLNTAATIDATIYTASDNKPFITSANGMPADAGLVTLNWPAVNYQGWHAGEDVNVQYLFKVRASNDDGSDIGSFLFNYIYAHDIDMHTTDFEPLPEEDPFAIEDKTIYYNNNTVCSFGPHFRNLTPKLTDKWYMFTALDLSKNGTQTYELVGGNMYVIGKVDVIVEGDNVTVKYEYVPGIQNLGEFLTFFPDYDSVTTVNPEEIDSSYVFGQTYSIANDLNGDTDVLLFVRNMATFNDANPKVVRFWENLAWRKELREHMLGMIGWADK